jgi:hypothetical protein
MENTIIKDGSSPVVGNKKSPYFIGDFRCSADCFFSELLKIYPMVKISMERMGKLWFVK